MIRAPEKLQYAWVKVFPHIVDTVLLLSAFLMLYTLQLSIIENNWLIAKICALLVYIFLGMLALKPGRPLVVRVTAWVSAMLTCEMFLRTLPTSAYDTAHPCHNMRSFVCRPRRVKRWMILFR